MIHRVEEKKTVMEEIISEIECDCCHKKFDREAYLEIQEFLHIRLRGGYGSIFGDEADIEGDFCQHCLKNILGPYLRIGPDWLYLEAERHKIKKEGA